MLKMNHNGIKMSNFDKIIQEAYKELDVISEADWFDRAYYALSSSPFGKAKRMSTMALNISPMNKWNSPVDASNVYTLDPRGPSQPVVDKFIKHFPAGYFDEDVNQEEGESIPIGSEKWIKIRAVLLINDREGGHSTSLRSLASGKEERSSVSKITNVDDLKDSEKENIRILSAGVNLQKVHDELKKQFANKGVYCGTSDQYDVYKKGTLNAITNIAGSLGGNFVKQI